MKWHKNLSRLARLILHIIPFTGWFIAAFYRIDKGLSKKDNLVLLAGILAIPFGFIFWLVDLITVVLSDQITILA